jgi:hypothetical protein
MLIRDNLTDHGSAETVVWPRERGIVPLHTPLTGGRLNMTEAIVQSARPQTSRFRETAARFPVEMGA